MDEVNSLASKYNVKTIFILKQQIFCCEELSLAFCDDTATRSKSEKFKHLFTNDVHRFLETYRLKVEHVYN